jgi:UDP-N-acetylmuramate dehydrogenase
MIAKELRKLKIGNILENVDLKNYNTFKVSTIADAIAYPKDIESLIKLLKYVKKNNIKHKILGNGSNVIFGDEPYNGVLIKLDNLNKLEVDDIKITVGAGYNLTKFALRVSQMGLTGMEWAVGIPGTIGGAVFMNAGAYKSDMGYNTSEIKVLDEDYNIKTIYNKDLNFHYRTSLLTENRNLICLEATIILRTGKKEAIMALISERKQRRLMTQPLEYPSAGSVFRNPIGDFAGRLIEINGWKGKRIGDALVSEKHANFIINVGNAKGNDIKKLITDIQKDIKDKTGIELKTEQEFIE